MKKLLIILCIAITSVILSGCASTNSSEPAAMKAVQPLDFEKRKKMAVLPYDFKDKNVSYQGLETGLVDLTINSFFETKRFLLIERSKLKEVIGELQYNASGMVGNDNALKVGKHVGAKYVFAGVVTSINPLKEHKSLGIATIDRKGFEVTLQGRIIDVEQSVVIASATAKGKELQTKKMAMGAKTGSIAPDDTLIRMAFEKAVKVLVNDLASQ